MKNLLKNSTFFFILILIIISLSFPNDKLLPYDKGKIDIRFKVTYHITDNDTIPNHLSNIVGEYTDNTGIFRRVNIDINSLSSKEKAVVQQCFYILSTKMINP